MRDGAKEFHLIAMPVEREFLPHLEIDVWGFNGTMPGPMIEVNQGDRVRTITLNHMVSMAGPMTRVSPGDPRGLVPGFPQNLEAGMEMEIPEDDVRLLARREARGLRRDWSHIKGLTTIVRVLPPDLYEKVMSGTEPLPPGSSIFGPIPARRKMTWAGPIRSAPPWMPRAGSSANQRGWGMASMCPPGVGGWGCARPSTSIMPFSSVSAWRNSSRVSM
jgi:hypothetical protein